MTSDADWLHGLRHYLAVTAIASLFWETAQLPLYTIWNNSTSRENAFAVLHCTGGDILIALGAWALAVIVAGRPGWPAAASRRIAFLTLAAGLAYTGFSEWLNTAVRRSWTYSEWMPVLPYVRIGVSPMLQWVAVPSLALWAAGRGARRLAVPRLGP